MDIPKTHKMFILISVIAGFVFWAIYRWAPTLAIAGVEIITVYVLGIISVLIILFVMTYSLRKRLARGMPGRLDNWLWAHIYLGLLVLFIIALHAEFRLSWDYNTIGIIFLVLVIITGIVGRYFYTRVPVSIAVEQEKVLSQVEESAKSIKQLLEGKSRPFQKLIGSELNTPSPISPMPVYWEDIRAKSEILPEEERKDFKKAIDLLEQKAKLEVQSISQLKYKPFFRAWLLAHIFVTVGVIVIIPLHVLDDSFRVFPLKASDFGHPQQCRQCHQRQYDEWIMSPHAYGQLSPVAFALNAKTQEDSNGKVGTFCFQCHAPISIAIGEDGNTPNDERHPIGILGVQCDSCHSMPRDHGLVSGEFSLEPSRTKYGPFGSGNNGDKKAIRNSAHRNIKSDYIQSSEFCGSCHNVVTPTGLRVQETFSEWKETIYAEKGITCQDCHMRTIPGKPDQKKVIGPAAIIAGEELPMRELSNHAMIGVDYHIIDDFPYPDNPQENARIQREYMQEVYEFHKGGAKMEVEAPKSVVPGSTFEVDVHVTNIGAGHNLPTGTALRQLWIEIIVKDAEDSILFVSGDFDTNMDLRDRCSVAVKLGGSELDKYLVNFQSEMLKVEPDGTEEDAFLTSQGNKFIKNSIPHGETRTGRYPISVPPDVKGPLNVDVRLRFRHLSPLLIDRLSMDKSFKDKLIIIDKASESKLIEVDEKVVASNSSHLNKSSKGVVLSKAVEGSHVTIKGIVMDVDQDEGTIVLKDANGKDHKFKVDPKLLEGVDLCGKVEVVVEGDKVVSLKKL